ncbi:MAG: hypothetical protein JSS66_04205 [Armatimonadetes bacterium]|nr:hypothetical protein [Armatimonadota bacterium]
MLCAALALCFLGQEPPSLYSALVPNPTGKNGYEEYLAAADMVRTAEFKSALDLLDQAKPGNTNLLSLKRKAVAAAPKVRDLMRAAALKQVVDPRSAYSLETTFYEFSYFRRVQRLLGIQAGIQFVDGEPKQAVDTIGSMISFSFGLENTGVLISFLVGLANQDMALKGIVDNMEQIPLPSTMQLSKLADVGLALNPIERSMKIESVSCAESFARLLKNRSSLAEIMTEGAESPLFKQVGALSDPDFRAAVSRAEELVVGHNAAIARIAATPETQWKQLLTDETTRLDSEPNMVARGLAELFIVPAQQILRNEARRRVQLRLLKVHMMVRAYKLNAQALPVTLDVLNDQALVRDPLTGKPFVYERKGEKYELYSPGIFDGGRIDLSIQRGARAKDDESVPIRPE